MPLVPAYIRDLSSYKPGKPIEEVHRELGITDVVKLASNENASGPSPRALAAMKLAMESCHRYPDAMGFKLRDALARRYSVKMENVVLGAGSEGIMSTIMRTFLLSDDEIISAANSFIGFQVLANATGRRIHWVPMKNNRYNLPAMAEAINDYTKIIYIANPDNPMGTYITRQEFDAFYTHVPPRVLIILDEAYFEFTRDIPDFPDSMTYRYDNVITLRTFSKAFGLAGIRIGYGFAHETLIDNIMKVKVPFEPSFLAQVAGYAALGDTNFMTRTLELNETGKASYYQHFDRWGIRYIPTATNFITTIWNSEKQAAAITDQLLRKGVIVRHLAAFGWPECIRISIGLEHENQRCLDALQTILNGD
ncbi:MAG: histidinol-phosphate transaminase [Fidelibacterota bacterium]